MRPQKGIRKDAGVVSVAEGELQCVASDRFDVLHCDEDGNVVRRELECTGPFVRAGGAGTVLAQVADRIDALVPVGPLDPEHALLDPLHVFGFEDCRCHGIPL